jgi:hypothetical protein
MNATCWTELPLSFGGGDVCRLGVVVCCCQLNFVDTIDQIHPLSSSTRGPVRNDFLFPLELEPA